MTAWFFEDVGYTFFKRDDFVGSFVIKVLLRSSYFPFVVYTFSC